MTCTLDQDAFTQLVERQGSLWRRSQAIELGVSHKMIRTRVANGVWADHGHGVLGLPGVPWTFRRSLWRAHLAGGPDSVVSHEAAAVAHRLRGFGGEPVVVTRSHGSWSGYDDVVFHQLDDCEPRHRSHLRGLPVTNIERTFVDLAAVTGRARLNTALEEELSRGRVSIGSVTVVLQEVARPGKPGIRRLQGVLDGQIGNRPGASRLEALMKDQLRRLPGLPYEVEVPLPHRGEMVGIVDYSIRSCRIVIEVDGRRWHDRRQDMIRDRDRDNAAAAAGWQTLRFMWEHLTQDPDGVRALILATCAGRRRDSIADVPVEGTLAIEYGGAAPTR